MDAYSPGDIAQRAETVGVAKAKQDFVSTFMLAILAGAFIGLGGCFFTTVVTETSLGYGPTRLLGGLAFSLGLILVIVAGAELFTGNNLIIMATISGKVSAARLMHNWVVVYLGNLVGSLATAALVYFACQWKANNSAVGVTAYNIAGSKLALPFATAFFAGVLCNALVCLAVWLCYSAGSTTDKILSIVFPITAFVALGFEHSVANMYFVPYGIMLAHTDEFVNGAATAGLLKFDPSIYTAGNFVVSNLLPVTLGNIVGGSLMVGVVYWIIYLRGGSRAVGDR